MHSNLPKKIICFALGLGLTSCVHFSYDRDKSVRIPFYKIPVMVKGEEGVILSQRIVCNEDKYYFERRIDRDRDGVEDIITIREMDIENKKIDKSPSAYSIIKRGRRYEALGIIQDNKKDGINNNETINIYLEYIDEMPI